MAFKRGFKSQCERRSVEIRKDLGYINTDPLCAFELAKYFGITVWSTSQVNGLSEQDLQNLTETDDDCWSALTLRLNEKHLIIYKQVENTARINSVVMHEISHIILGHQLADACIMEDGSLVPSNFSQDQEDEADWLGGTLLLPRPTLLMIRKTSMSNTDASQKYNVSNQMLTWRFRMTGVDFQMNHHKRKKL